MSDNQLHRAAGSTRLYVEDLRVIEVMEDPREAYQRCIDGARRVVTDRNYDGRFEKERKGLEMKYLRLASKISERDGSTEARGTEL